MVRAHLPTDLLRFTGRNIVAVAGIVAVGQQKTLPSVMTPPQRVFNFQTAIEFRVQEVVQVVEVRFLCNKKLLLVSFRIMRTKLISMENF